MDKLVERFSNVARGRTVSVSFEAEDAPWLDDYHVRFKADTNTIEVVFRRGGLFEGAYRVVERFVEATAERLDGIHSPPAGYLDLRCETYYWLFEQSYEQFRSDLNSAIAEKTSWLERERPGEDGIGGIRIEARTRYLVGLLTHLRNTDLEVRRAVLSPQTIALLRDIGFDLLSPTDGKRP